VGEVLYISQNAALTNLDGLSGITLLDGGLGIVNNPTLTNLDGLSGITSVGEGLEINGWLEILFNAALTNLDGLSALTSVSNDLYISDNTVLPDCEACDLLDQLTTAPFLIDVHDNLDDSCTPVPAGCP